MPKMGESITEGTILKWLKKAGDAVKKDEPILEISTDKVDTEVPSPVAGTLTRLMANEKDVVPVGATVAYISSSSSATVASTAPAPQPVASAPIAVATTPAAAPVAVATTTAVYTGNKFYSPLVKSIAKQEGIA
ncbi:biotin/lipoyl-containing protein, partial [Vibrio parahaemolyticus]|uniref:biotin/lipoyl-containing protein n=1 Tax=Vibrio parahaemolyticus TaxID=670 RepID=UPI002A245029